MLIVAGVALYVAAPLFGRESPDRAGTGAELQLLTHQQGLAIQGLRELEFDRQMGKLSQSDYLALRVPLESRALAAMKRIEELREQAREAAERPAPRPLPEVRAVPPARPRRVNYCPQCGIRIRGQAKFCTECGAAIEAIKRAAIPA
ncbi:MAG: zinc ribbon domain-containing protein [Candidatus Binataceae bacterium]